MESFVQAEKSVEIGASKIFGGMASNTVLLTSATGGPIKEGAADG